MGLPELEVNLKRLAGAGQPVPLNAALLSEAGLSPPSDLDALIERHFRLSPGASLSVKTTAGQIGEASPTKLAMSGSLTALSVTVETATITFSAAGNAVNFTLLAPLGKWTFDTSFRFMTGFPFEGLEFEAPAFVFATVAQEGFLWQQQKIALARGMNLAADVGAKAGPFGQVPVFVPSASGKLPAWGALDAGAIKEKGCVLPDLSLKASFPPGSLPAIGPLRLSEAALGVAVVTEAGTVQTGQLTKAYLAMSLELGKGVPPIVSEVTMPFAGGEMLLRAAPADERKDITLESLFTLMGGRSWYSVLPAPLQGVFSAFKFKGFVATIGDEKGKPKLRSTSLTVGSGSEWQPLLELKEFTLKEIDFTWTVRNPLGGSKARMSGELTAVAKLLPSIFEGSWTFTISTDLRISGEFAGHVKLSRIVSGIAGHEVKLPAGLELEVTSIAVLLERSTSTCAFSATANASVELPLGAGKTLALEDVQVAVVKAPANWSASLDGTIALAGVAFALHARYEGGPWSFAGGLRAGSSIPLGELLNELFEALKLPGFVPGDLEVTPLWLTAESKPEAAHANYTLDAGLRWKFNEGALQSMNLSAELKLAYDGSYSGSLVGEAKVPLLGGKVTADVLLGYDFGKSEDLWVTWRGFARAKYVFATNTIEFSLEVASLGSMIAEIVRIIEGDPNFQLPEPWNLLEKISLRGFSVVWRLKPKEGESPIELQYDLQGNDIDLWFITIKKLGITVKNGKVVIDLYAKFLTDSAYEWKPVPASEPPTPPGGETSTFELELLALGQHVTVDGLSEGNVTKAIELMGSFNPPAKADEVPIPPNPPKGQPIYSPGSGWLVGTHFLIEVDRSTKPPTALLDLKLVFNDPNIYGLRIELGGPKSGIFKELAFEIVYRKVTETIGVYEVELQLPAAMRHLEFGEVSITLPIVGVQIYTNGNWRIDFGFPANMNWSRCFGVEAFPFTGEGGFYFGVLSGETAPRLPQTTKGRFDPVYVFGLGLRIGLGKSIDEGIFSAELSLTVFGIVEGVIASWHPYPTSELVRGGVPLVAPAGETGSALVGASSGGTDEEYFYWIQGTIGIVGTLVGRINFAIISAEVNVTAQAWVQMTIEAHREIPVHMQAGVSVAITVKIDLGLFSINLHFSFSITVTADFVIGQNTIAPWDPASGLVAARAALAPLPAGIAAAGGMRALAVTEPVKLTLYAAPQLTLSDWSSGNGGVPGAYVLMLYIEGPVASAAETGTTPFEVLSREALLWAITNFGSAAQDVGAVEREQALSASVTAADVARAFAHFAADGAPPLTYEEVREFLSTQFELSISPGKEIESAAVFPMLPDLELEVPAWGGKPAAKIDFAHYSTCGEEYLKAVREEFEKLAVQLETELEREQGGGGLRRAGEAGSQSLASFLCVDYFTLICRHTLQAAREAFAGYRYPPKESDSLSSIAIAFNAAAPEHHEQLTPGSIGAANASAPLAARKPVHVEGARWTLRAGQSFAALARSFGLTPSQLGEANEGLQGFIAPNRKIELAGGYTTGQRDSIADIRQSTGATLEQVVAAIGEDATLIVPLVALALPAFTHVTSAETPDTLGALGVSYGVAAEALAADSRNAQLGGLFASAGAPLTLPPLEFLTALQIAEALLSQHVISHLAGIASRFMLNGMRLPVGGGIEVDPASTCAGKESCGLYSLSGQQLSLPPLSEADAEKYELVLNRGAQGGWIHFAGGGSQVGLKIEAPQIKRINEVLAAAGAALEPGVKALEALPPTAGVLRRYTLPTTAPVELPGPLTLAGLSTSAPTIYPLPDAMLNVLSLPAAAEPAFTLQVGTAQPGHPIEEAPVQSSAWASTLTVSVKRTATAPAGSYELIGTDDVGATLLERLLSTIGEAVHPIAGTCVLYRQSVTAQSTTGLRGDEPATQRAFIVQANLSTETRPHAQVLSEAVARLKASPVNQDAETFVRLLWECTIVGGGGFFMYYEGAQGSPGVPDYLFDDQGQGQLTLAILYEQPGGQLGGYVNAALVADTVDPSHQAVLARSQSTPVSYAVQREDSLQRIASSYHLTLPQLASALADESLALEGAKLTIAGALHETRFKDTLESIAQHFGTTGGAIEAANPALKIDWQSIPAWTLLSIPTVTCTLSAGSQLSTLAKVAEWYGVEVAALGFTNQQVPGLLRPGTTLSFDDELLDATATRPAGAAGFMVKRQLLGGEASNPAVYLDASFHLLGWQLSENVGFKGSPSGLPLAPGEQLEAAQLEALRAAPAAPRAGQTGASVEYQQMFPVPRYARYNPLERGKAEAGVPPAAANPYAGVGFAAQPYLEWRDLFGNRARTPLSDPSVDPSGPANKPAVAIAYTDKLLALSQWPGLTSSFEAASAGGQPGITIELRFDPSRFAEAATSEQAKQAAQAARQTYAQVYYQLHQSDQNGEPHVTASLSSTLDGGVVHTLGGAELEKLLGFAVAIWRYLDGLVPAARANAAPPPEPVTLALALPASNPSDIFALEVSLTLTRDSRWVAPESSGEDGVAQSVTTIAARAMDDDAKPYPLSEFARTFESVYAGAHLKLAVGSTRAAGADAASTQTLWAVRLSADGSSAIGASVSGEAVYWAPPPLSRSLISRPEVRIRPFDPEHGLGPARSEEFTQIDLDVWARQALAAIDDVLLAQNAVPAFIVDALGATSSLEALRTAKRSVAAAIAARVELVLEEEKQPADLEAARTAAQQTWEQQLLVTLSSAYVADVAIQLPLEVKSDGEPPYGRPALYGHPVASEPKVGLGAEEAEQAPYTLSDFKLSASAGTSYLTFLCTVRSPSAQRSLTLDVAYQVDQIEHEITAVPGIAGYQASSWLTFPIPPPPLPFADAAAERLEIPVLLRAYPQPPTLRSQEGVQHIDQSNAKAALESATRWTYESGYAQIHAAQDVVDASATFNLDDVNGLALRAEQRDLFDALAQLISVYPAIKEVLDAELPSVTTATSTSDPGFKRAATALAALASLSEEVGTLWSSWKPPLGSRGLAAAAATVVSSTYDFSIAETNHEEDLLVTVASKEPPPPGVPQAALAFTESEPVPTGAGVRYRRADGKYITWTEAQDEPDRTLEVGPLSAMAYQNALLGLQITRNQPLVERDPTSEDFVYVTPMVEFASKCAPLLGTDVPIDVSAIAEGTPRRATLLAHLQTLFEAFFAHAATSQQTVKLLVGFRSPVAAAVKLPPVEVPILFVPSQSFEVPAGWSAAADLAQAVPGSLDAFVQVLRERIAEWVKERQPVLEGAALTFELSAFSSLNNTTLPLIQLNGLELAFGQITEV